MEEKVVAVILVGGPTKGKHHFSKMYQITQTCMQFVCKLGKREKFSCFMVLIIAIAGTNFRPLSFNTPKPLFPIAGQAMVHHPLSACKTIPNLAQVFLIGFYEERDFALYVSSISMELKIPVRYLKEDKPRGSAGGVYYFRDLIMEDNPSHIFLLNFDICCNFPLPEMLGVLESLDRSLSCWDQTLKCLLLLFKFADAHKSYGGMGTLLVIRVCAESANQFGELVADPTTKEVLHYTEKPETFVSDLINCGVYVFTPEIFSAIESVYANREEKVSPSRRLSGSDAFQLTTRSNTADFVRLDQDILSPLAGKKQLYTYETVSFWEQIKTPGMSLRCSALYLAHFRSTSSHLLASGDGTKNALISGDVYVHPSAKVHPTAKIGPNVSVSANVRIGAGVRLINCIILDDVELLENAVVMNAIIGWKSSIGRWSRADGDYNSKLGVTILGECVTVEDEVVVISCVVLPNKVLNVNVHEEIIL
ncbi:hypothetical protein V2J09_002166 [Rumex salicifolius]